MLLEAYLVLFGSHNLRRSYNKMRRDRVTTNRDPEEEEVISLLNMSQFAVYGFLLLIMPRGSQTINDPLYQMTGFMKSRGLSNQGLSIISRFGLCYPKSTFLRHKDGCLAVLANELRSDIQNLDLISLILLSANYASMVPIPELSPLQMSDSQNQGTRTAGVSTPPNIAGALINI